MDVFVEKIVRKKKDRQDSLISSGIVFGSLVLIFVVIPVIPVINALWLFFDVAIIYFAYVFISARNVEYEYAVTNGEIDIDKIVARRKRKRIFSGHSKDFELVAKVKSQHYTPDIQRIENKIFAVSSVDAPNAYFITVNYKGARTLVIFEPDERMLESFRVFNPRKIVIDR